MNSTPEPPAAFRDEFDDEHAADEPRASAGSRLVLLGAVLAGLLFVYWFWNPYGDDRSRGPGHPAVGERLEWAELPPLVHADRGLSAADVADKVTLVNFWGPWCPPCREEFPKLMTLREHFAGEPDFQLVSIACGASLDEPTPVLRKNTVEFLDWLGARPPVYDDADAALRQRLATTARLDGFAYPTTVLLDGAGVIRGVWIGYYEGEEAKIRVEIDKVLQASRAGRT